MCLFHAHIETLFYKRFLIVYVRTRTNIFISTMLMDISGQTFLFKSFVLAIKNNRRTSALATRLLKSSWSTLHLNSRSVFGLGRKRNIRPLPQRVLPRPWYIKLQTLSIKDLIVVKSGWCLIKANIFSRKYFIVQCPAFISPLSPIVLIVILDLIPHFQNLITTSNQWIITIPLLPFPLPLWVENPHIGVGRFQHIETVSGGHKDAVYFGSLFLSSSKHTSKGLGFTLQRKIVFTFLGFLHFYYVTLVLPWVWT